MWNIFLVISVLTVAVPSYGQLKNLSAVVTKDSHTDDYCPFTNQGEVCHMTQAQAYKYCDSQRGHLPTAKEYALYAVDHGAVGLAPTSFSNDPFNADFYTIRLVNEAETMNKNGYHAITRLIKSYNLDGRWNLIFFMAVPRQPKASVYFYYNLTNYKRAAGDLSNEAYWTSSPSPDSVDDDGNGHLSFGRYYYFENASGEIYDVGGGTNTEGKLAVRCILGN